MRLSYTFLVPSVAGLAAASLAFISSAGAQDASPIATTAPLESAIFAGGCFWCVESDFDKVEGVVETISGYTGGNKANPTYKQVTFGDTGHYEAVKVTYDPAKVSYEDLVSYFFRHVDPTDAEGQFCDKGDSYRTAIFTGSIEELAVAKAEKLEIEESGQLGAPVVTVIEAASEFYPAEDYHQDYYTKNPIKYRYYRSACGRDKRLEQLWGKSAEG